LIAISIFAFISNIYAARIKDIAVIQGTTDVQAIGYGIVTD
jgi:flagellar basal body P-ring protein FlgI